MNRKTYQIGLQRKPVVIIVTSPPQHVESEIDKPKNDVVFPRGFVLVVGGYVGNIS